MGLALALPLAFYLLLGNVQKLGDALGQSQAISVFLQPGRPRSRRNCWPASCGDRADVAAVTVKTPQQGMDELAKMQGFSGALNSAGRQPVALRAATAAAPRGAGASASSTWWPTCATMRGVDMVQDSGSWRQRLDALLGVGNRAVLILASLLALAALLVVGNTVRVDIASRSEEIGVLLLVGASSAFVRRPYLYAGIWYGLFSGVLAALLAVLIEFALAAPVAQLSAAYDGKLQIGGVAAVVAAGRPAGGGDPGLAGRAPGQCLAVAQAGVTASSAAVT